MYFVLWKKPSIKQFDFPIHIWGSLRSVGTIIGGFLMTRKILFLFYPFLRDTYLDNLEIVLSPPH